MPVLIDISKLSDKEKLKYLEDFCKSLIKENKSFQDENIELKEKLKRWEAVELEEFNNPGW